MNFKTSNDEKSFLASIKNLTGNAIDDKKLINYSNLNDKEFLKTILQIFNEKRDEKIKLISSEHYQDLEKKIFLQIM